MLDKSLSPEDYEAFQNFLSTSSGIVLGDKKHYLVTSRLVGLLEEFKVNTVGELIRQLRSAGSTTLRERVIEAMTTNETFWFRDSFPFDIFQDTLVPELAAKGKYPIRVWCAASSSGQEPYSLSMAIQEYNAKKPGSLRGEVQILGTDISPKILRAAKAARYDTISMSRGLSPERKKKFFLEKDGMFELRPEVTNRVTYRQLNLLQSYALLGRFDVIFCRNVLIYFSVESKRDIMNRLAQALNPGGYLLLGASESMASLSDAFEMVRCNPGVIYRRL